MNDKIWRVDVSDEYLTFTQEECPSDFEEKAEKQPDSELDGTYCGNRGYDDVQFKLVRRLKAENFYSSDQNKDMWGNFSLREWRLRFGFAYAWSPSYYYRYDGKLYTTHINFR
jgi:hypothetical protein